MHKKNNYITDREYEIALNKYYNGLEDFTGHIDYKKSIADKFEHNPRLVEEFLVAGERYTILERGYVITSYGRVFNLRFRRFLKPKFYNSDIYIYCGSNNYRLEPTFIEMNWKFDKVEILRRYLDNDWSSIVMDNCKYAHEV
jgi:hypothetical protein